MHRKGRYFPSLNWKIKIMRAPQGIVIKSCRNIILKHTGEDMTYQTSYLVTVSLLQITTFVHLSTF
jgi:hypothetical protein